MFLDVTRLVPVRGTRYPVRRGHRDTVTVPVTGPRPINKRFIYNTSSVRLAWACPPALAVFTRAGFPHTARRSPI